MKTALLFSGGKDSMACLYLFRSKLPEITVIFCDTGKNYPEALALIEKTLAFCPIRSIVRTDRDGQWAAHGLPSDVVPINWTREGQKYTGIKPVTVQSYLQCCAENIMLPVWNAIKAGGFTEVIRGQRLEESHKSTVRDGDTVDGVTFRHPVENWTRAEVLAYLTEQMGELPDHYRLNHSSLDCYDCTAYAWESVDRVEWMRERHPLLYADYAAKANAVNTVIAEALHA